MEPCSQQAGIAHLQSEVKTIFKRIDEQMSLSKAVYELVAEVRVMNLKLQTLSDTQDRFAKDVEELKSNPKKRWESIIQSAISAVVGGLIAFVLIRLGLK